MNTEHSNSELGSGSSEFRTPHSALRIGLTANHAKYANKVTKLRGTWFNFPLSANSSSPRSYLRPGHISFNVALVIKRSHIRAFSDAIARRFHPRKIVLFGSYAYGRPTKDSDVDLLVVMDRTRDRGERMAVRILHAIPRDFPLDLLVRTPTDVARRLKWKDPFICEVVHNGKVLYEAHDS